MKKLFIFDISEINILILLLLTLFNEITFNLFFRRHKFSTLSSRYPKLLARIIKKHFYDRGIKDNHFVARICPQAWGSPLSRDGDNPSCETATGLPHVGRYASILLRPPIISFSPRVRLACRSVKLLPPYGRCVRDTPLYGQVAPYMAGM